jgi:hypothetical protein
MRNPKKVSQVQQENLDASHALIARTNYSLVIMGAEAERKTGRFIAFTRSTGKGLHPR